MHNAEMDHAWFQAKKKELKLTDIAIGEVLGKDRSVVNKIITGASSGSFSPAHADELARLFKVPRIEMLVKLGYLRDDDLPRLITRPVLPPANDDDIAEIASLDLSLSMGPGTLIEEFVESESVKVSLSFIQAITRTPSDRLRFVRGIGDSMEPTLRSSDLIMVDINERQLSRISGIYWINREGAHGIKRLRPAGKGRILIISDNPVEENDEVDAREIMIEGRAIWVARGL